MTGIWAECNEYCTILSKICQGIWRRNNLCLQSKGPSTNNDWFCVNVARFAKLQDLIAVQTGVSAAQQRFFYKYNEFKPDPMAPSLSYPNTSVSDSVTLLTLPLNSDLQHLLSPAEHRRTTRDCQKSYSRDLKIQRPEATVES